MVRRSCRERLVASRAAARSLAACGSSIRSSASQTPRRPQPPRPPQAPAADRPRRLRQPVEDPVLTLIADSDAISRPASGSSQHGHVDGGQAGVRPAVDVLLESPYGGRTEPRIREHFDRLVDRISAYEVKALAEGDGFTEKQYEPASIDELLAMSATLGTAAGDAGAERRRRSPISQIDRARHPDSAQPARAGVRRAVPGPSARFPRGRHEARQQVPADDSERLPRRRAAARSGLRAAGRERLQAERAVARQGEGRLAVHARHRRSRTACGRTGTSTSGRIPKRRRSPRRSISGRSRKMFDGDWHLALASYNGGPGRLQRAMKTRQARRLLGAGREAAAAAARNPRLRADDSGGDRHRPEPGAVRLRLRDRAAARVRDGHAAAPVDLRRVAEWADTTIDEIQALNPELRRWTTPVRDDAYELKVPVGTAEIVTAQAGRGGRRPSWRR